MDCWSLFDAGHGSQPPLADKASAIAHANDRDHVSSRCGGASGAIDGKRFGEIVNQSRLVGHGYGGAL